MARAAGRSVTGRVCRIRARAGASVSRAQPVHGREGGIVSPAVPGSHRCLPGSLGGQDLGQVGLRAGLRQRVAGRRLREAAHQVRRLQPPAAGAAVGFGDLRPPGRQANGRRLSAAGRRHLPLPGSRFRRGRVAAGRAGVRAVLRRAGRAGGAGNFALGPGRACLGVLRRACVGARCPAPGHRHHQPHLRAHPATEAGVLRPLVSQPGHDAQGRVRQPDRAAAAEAPARKRLQRVCGCRAAAARRPVGLSRVHPAHGPARHRADHPARHRRRSPAGRDVHRRRGSGHALEAPVQFVHQAGGHHAPVVDRDAGQPDLLREERAAPGAGQSADPPGGLPEPRVLQGPGHAHVGVGQAPRHRQRRELPAAHRACRAVAWTQHLPC